MGLVTSLPNTIVAIAEKNLKRELKPLNGEKSLQTRNDAEVAPQDTAESLNIVVRGASYYADDSQSLVGNV